MIFKPVKTWKDALDQFLHMVWGGSLVFLFSLNIPVVFAFVVSMTVGVIREMLYQHPLDCGPGCRTDLGFWTLSSFIVMCLMFYISAE